ncbi:pantetheine-phosphate adenylyltransferase [Legionella sp. D16C41]|uniref:pantetheine-phosphate adenylyltransferase n=1 Tax=Legionella sp. D16C41 TaxID=3402688 RepID=UPI003AF9A054
MKQRAIYPGTFDPITNGHIDIIKRAAQIFPEIIVGVASNETKNPFFPVETRIELTKQALEPIPGVKVVGFDTLLIDFVKQQQGNIILRGLRAVNDFEYEFQLAGMNRKLCADIETIFLTPSEDLMFISSTLVREIARLKGDVSQFVPLGVIEALREKLNKEHE